jgi:hypothetical protein
LASAALTTAVIVSRLYYIDSQPMIYSSSLCYFHQTLTDTTPMTPYPPSSAALSIRTALLFSIVFSIVIDDRVNFMQDKYKVEEENKSARDRKLVTFRLAASFGEVGCHRSLPRHAWGLWGRLAELCNSSSTHFRKRVNCLLIVRISPVI